MARDDRGALVVHPGALGDVLQAVPALRALRREARLTFCGQPRLGQILVGAGVIERAVSFDTFGLEALFADGPAPAALAGRLRDYDAIVSWFGSRDPRYPSQLGALARACLVAPPAPGEDRAADGASGRVGHPTRAVWEHLLATIEPICGKALVDRSPLRVPEAWRDEARRALADLHVRADEPILATHPGAGGRWKQAPPDLLADAVAAGLRGHRVQVLVHAGPADREAADALAARLVAPAHVLREPALPLLAGVLSLAAAYLGGDSGVSHLAAAVGAPAVILFPSTTRDRWAPWSATARAVAMAERGAAPAAATALADAIAAWRRSGP